MGGRKTVIFAIRPGAVDAVLQGLGDQKARSVGQPELQKAWPVIMSQRNDTGSDRNADRADVGIIPTIVKPDSRGRFPRAG